MNEGTADRFERVLNEGAGFLKIPKCRIHGGHNRRDSGLPDGF